MSFDWPAIKAAIERGMTPTEIAKTLPNVPTRQAIEKRIAKEGWAVARLPEAPSNLPVSQRDIVLTNMRVGATYEQAAAAAGIADNTLRLWRSQDPVFDAACQAQRAAWLVSKVKQINDAPDWKAAAYLLERSAETKEQFSPKSEGSGGVTVILKVDRTEGVTVDGKRG